MSIRPESSLGLLQHPSLFPKLSFVQSLPALGEEEVHKTFDDEDVDSGCNDDGEVESGMCDAARMNDTNCDEIVSE